MSSVVWLSDPSKGLVRSVRQGQIRMAKHVEACVEEGGIVIVQGGTGTGKGMASLVPLCASGKVKRAVYSTAKKTLQRQILDDIPVVAERVRARRYAKRLGKGNYACAVRADEFREEQAHRFDPTQVAEFFAWMGTTDYDELSEYGYKLPFESFVRVSECLKHKCPKRRECGYLDSIQAAKEAEILVVNHALLAYDLAVGGGKVLGQYDALIIDEAQNLERPVLLTALSRLGEGSRVVLTHDVAQRDNLRVGRHDGIASVISALRGHPIFAHVTFTRSERSAVAALVTSLLDDPRA